MTLRIVGAGLPRTGTSSLRRALEGLLGGPCCHMSALPGHPFDLGPAWDAALAGQPTDWGALLQPYRAAVDWPASLFWRELSAANPQAIVLLSLRDSAEQWWQSADATILPVARMALAPGWTEGRALVTMLERFTGTTDWDRPEILMAAYERHNAEVQRAIPPERLLNWQAAEGWTPICRALDLPIPAEPFPWTNRRADWS